MVEAVITDLPTASQDIVHTQFPEVERTYQLARGNTIRMFYVVDGRTTPRSRYIMQRHLNRELRENEVVHHINGNGLDDRIENLRVMSRKEHSALHSSMAPRSKYNLIHTDTLPSGGCVIKKMVGKYGPYLYYVKRINGRQYWKYLGKASSALARRAGNCLAVGKSVDAVGKPMEGE